MAELDDETHSQIEELAQVGDFYSEKGDYTNALAEYWKAFDLIPEPKTEWEATTWLLTAIGDANFLNKDYKAGADNFSTAMHCPNAIGNPFIHLRLGQCQFEIGNFEKAADELTRAYSIEGDEMFDSEEPKYFEFLKTKIKIEQSKKKPWWKF